MCPEFFLDREKVENSCGLSQSTEQKREIIYICWILDPKFSNKKGSKAGYLERTRNEMK